MSYGTRFPRRARRQYGRTPEMSYQAAVLAFISTQYLCDAEYLVIVCACLVIHDRSLVLLKHAVYDGIPGLSVIISV